MKLFSRKQLCAFLFALIALVFSSVTAHAADDFCWKDSYGRGAGTIPTGCSSGDNQAGLCYQKCPAGMKGVGPVCWSECPAGYTDMGAVCHINLPLTRDAIWTCTHWFPKWMGGACRWKDTSCPAGYTNAGLFCALTERPTPAGFKGTYLDPMKNTYARGAGTIPTGCKAGETNQAGLCYEACKPGYKGVGPVCWAETPSNWSACGMGAAKNSAACAQVVTNQVLSVAQVAAFVATAWAGGEGGMAVMAGRDVAAGASDVKALENVSSAAADARALEKGLEEGSAATKSASFTAKVKSGYNYAKTSQDAAWKKIAAASNCLQQIERAAGTISDFNQSSDPYVRAMANPALATDAAVISCLASIAGLNAKAPTAAEQSAANAAALKGETVFSAEQIANLKASATLAGVRALSRSAQVQKTAIERMQDTTVKAEAAKPTDTWTAEDYTRTAALMASVVDPTGVSATVAAYTYPKCSKIFK